MENVKKQILPRTSEDCPDIKGPVTLILSVVAPHFSVNGFVRRPPIPNLFFLAFSNLEDEIHFKCGRFVTSQNLECYINYLND